MSLLLPGIGFGVQGLLGLGQSLFSSDQMNDLINAELKRQARYNAAYETALQDYLSQSTASAGIGQVQKGTENALQSYRAIRDVPLTAQGSKAKGVEIGSGQPGASANTAWADLMGAMRAPQQGYSEFTLQQGLKNLRAAQQLGAIHAQAQASASALPLELGQAQHEYDWMGTLGGLAGTAGVIAAL